MTILTHGDVQDRPFARTVYAIAAKRFRGDLVLTEGDQEVKLTWHDGLVVAAHSPSPADSVGRVALNAGLLTTTQLSDILRQMAPGGSLLEAVAREARLDDSQRLALARRALAQRAVRAFAMPTARFALHSETSLAASPDIAPIPVRTLIYFGLMSHYSEERLERELTTVAGARFRLAATEQTGRARLAEYGFAAGGIECVRHLARTVATLTELEQALPNVSRKELLVTVYALLSTDDVLANRGSSQPGLEARPRAQSQPGLEARPRAQSQPAVAQSIKLAGAKIGKTTPEQTAEVSNLMRAKQAIVDRSGDHYELLGVSRASDTATIRKAYFALAKKLHPDRVRGTGATDDPKAAQRLFAIINGAFAALGTPDQRALYDATLAASGTGEGTRDQVAAENRALRLLSAEEHFLRGQHALRARGFTAAVDELRQAVAMNPDEPEHHAWLAWAVWCNAEDKDTTIIREVEQSLRRALSLSDKCVSAHFYRGQIAAACGDQKTALQHFQRVVQLEPSNREAELQVRLLESRQGKKDPGLLGRFKRT